MTTMLSIADFINRWTLATGARHTDTRQFLTELCAALDLPCPNSANSVDENSYSFGRKTGGLHGDGSGDVPTLDLYKEGCFVLVSIESHGQDVKSASVSSRDAREFAARSRRERGTISWEVAMQRAKCDAERIVSCLPPADMPTPFLVVVDVGHCFDLYARFSGTNGPYLHYPYPGQNRFMLCDLAKPTVQSLFHAIWSDPFSLDQSTSAVRVTEEVSDHLAELARMLGADGYDRNAVARFLMNCLLSLFAESVGLIPARSFTNSLESAASDQHARKQLSHDLLRASNSVGPFSVPLRHFQRLAGHVIDDPDAPCLNSQQISVLRKAAAADFSNVEPAILGALLEQALDPKERHRLGAHYTRRAYVERLIIPTIMEPLRSDWNIAQGTASQLFQQGKHSEACDIIRGFHSRLTSTRILDPSCGSGNFLYVAMEHMMRLEAEVLHSVRVFDENPVQSLQIDPRQFVGMEIDPRAAQIAELVLWIGYAQWHFRNRNPASEPPPTRFFANIVQCDALILRRPGEPTVADADGPIAGSASFWGPASEHRTAGAERSVFEWMNSGATPTSWPEADFVVGNPPFIGGKDKKHTLGHEYCAAVASAYPMLPESCDYVMYWWHKAAELVRSGKVRRFGFITTNSISQVSNRRVLSMHMESENPLHLVFAIPDHPWVDSSNGAAVRISMTVAERGRGCGILAESGTSPKSPVAALSEVVGVIHSNLRVGVDLTNLSSLAANRGLCNRGVVLNGSGFMVTQSQAGTLGLGRIVGLDRHIRHYRNG
ncbi:MAG: hypothetical protein FWD57_16975, partial [Polyangiaceae bacterium]|nr:hypothetical protein [Polyangiaceae bacterium]